MNLRRLVLGCIDAPDSENRHIFKHFSRPTRATVQHSVAPLAIFGEAEVLEQMGDLDAALKLYEEVKLKHPNPQVVLQKMEALKERRQRRDVDTGAGEVRDSGRKYRR